MWKFLYTVLVLPVLWTAFRVLWPFNRKVRRGLRGRTGSWQRLRVFIRNNPARQRLWVHASSMGEFEQAKPIIEQLRRQMPDLVVVATFFSPSGYDNNLRYRSIDAIAYIPFDTPWKARRFLTLLQPTAAVFIRYDVWPNHVWTCRRMGIPVMLANATMRPNSSRLLPGMRRFHRAVYNAMDVILTVSEQDADSFRRLRLSRPRIEAVGDTRYDRVAGKAVESRKRMPLPAALREGRRTLVIGSSWPEDEEVLLPVLFKLLDHDSSLQCIIVPHEPTIDHLEFLEYRLNGKFSSIRFSYLHAWQGERIIIVDSIGILLPLYAAADIAFVGGGFRSNVHNTLEPAAYGIPVIFGPKIANSQEAQELVDAGGGMLVHNKQECYRSMRRLIDDEAHRSDCGARAGSFVSQRCGATTRILEAVEPLLEAQPEAAHEKME